MLRRRIAAQGRQVIDLSPQLMLEVMDHGARRRDRLAHLAATESVERFDAKMLAERERRLVGKEGVAVMRQRAFQLGEKLLLGIAHQQFRRRNAGQFVEQRRVGGHFGQPKFTRAQVGIGEAKPPLARMDRAEVIGALRFEQIQLADRARADDLGDLARDDLAGLRFARLVANRHAAAGFDQLRNVVLRRVIRHAAHRDAVSFRQRDVEQGRRVLRIVEEHLVEVAEAEKEQGVRRHAGAQPLILLHHRRERFGHAGASNCEPAFASS